MKKILALTLISLFLMASTAFAGKGFPLTLAGITLGGDMEQYTSCCDMDLSSPMPDAPFLKEVHLKADFIPGIRGGSLTYANCGEIGKIARIKLKFHNRGKGLFKDLLERYTDAYGKPDNYAGDAFRNIIAWEWNFTRDDERLTLLLMWSREQEMRPGVSIKMTLTSLVDREYACFKKKFDNQERKKGGPSKIRDIGDFVPK